MQLTARQRKALLAIGIIVGFAAVPAIAGVFDNKVEVSGGVPVVAPNGPALTISGDTNVSLDDPSAVFPNANTVELKTESGNITAISRGSTTLDVAANDITGAYTNVSGVDASSAALTINPEDKAKVKLSGAATAVDWADYAVDDGSVDMVITGPDGTNTDVTFYGLPADTTITALNKSNGNPLDVQTTDANGDVTFTIHHSTANILLQQGDKSSIPEQSNPSPTGKQSSEPSQLSIDVDDDDFPDDEVDVTIDLDGSQVKSTTITSASTITESIPASGLTGGTHTWTVETTDSFGNTRTEQYEYRIPGNLYIRNETRPSQLVSSPVNVTVRFISGPDDEFTERVTDTGVVNLTGLPVDEAFVVTIRPEKNYVDRVVYFDENDIYEQQSVYLLNESYDTIETRFVLNDPTGSYSENSILYISRPINRSGVLKYRTVHADKFGVEGVTATLESDNRYRIRIAAQDGTTQDLGPYRSDASETVEVQPSSPGVEFDKVTDEWGYGAELDNRSLSWSYFDTVNETDSLTVWIHERGDTSNQLVANETYLNLGNASGQYTLTKNESEKAWVVNFVIDRGDGDEIHGTIVSNTANLVPIDLDEGWRNVLAAGTLLLLAGSFSVLNVGVGAVVFGIAGGILWYIGMLSGVTTGAAIVLYLLVAVAVYIKQGGRV